MRSKPPSRAVAVRVTETSETYQPSLPGVPAIEAVLSVRDDEGVRIGEPGAAVEPVRDPRDPAPGVRPGEGDGHVGSVPSVVPAIAGLRFRRRRRRRIDADDQGL